MLLLLKSHVKGFTRKDGSFVAPHETKVQKKPQQALWPGAHSKDPLPPSAYSQSLSAPRDDAPAAPAPVKKKWTNNLHGNATSWGGKPVSGSGQHTLFIKPKHYANAIDHPERNDDGEVVKINEPDKPSAPSTWNDPKAIACFTPGSDVPDELNGVRLKPWTDAPTTEVGWHYVEGQMDDLDEPEFHANGKKPAAGVIVQEADGRFWVINPTNGFGGYETTFPKGRTDDGMSMQASAIKEAFEETGLKVEITGYLGDVERSLTMARFYTARRVGGTPKAMGWETQAVQLVPADKLLQLLNKPVDHDIAGMVGIKAPASPTKKPPVAISDN